MIHNVSSWAQKIMSDYKFEDSNNWGNINISYYDVMKNTIILNIKYWKNIPTY